MNLWRNVISYTKPRFSISGGYAKLYQEIIDLVRLNKIIYSHNMKFLK
jgi:hypothetical protein